MHFSLQDSVGDYLDAKLDRLFGGKTKGVYIELGANDGLTQSNTAFLEFERGWTGLLIEPSLSKFTACQKNRPNSICENGACVSKFYTEKTIKGDFNGNLMSSVNGERTSCKELVEVPAFTLQSLLKKHDFGKIDLLSLDTEGFELEVLLGVDLSVYRPQYLLIEIYQKDFDAIVSHLENYRYKLLQNFSNYNKITNFVWDGTHNDYLFVDSARRDEK
jgi:FkbM family methyltransferase